MDTTTRTGKNRRRKSEDILAALERIWPTKSDLDMDKDLMRQAAQEIKRLRHRLFSERAVGYFDGLDSAKHDQKSEMGWQKNAAEV